MTKKEPDAAAVKGRPSLAAGAKAGTKPLAKGTKSLAKGTRSLAKGTRSLATRAGKAPAAPEPPLKAAEEAPGKVPEATPARATEAAAGAGLYAVATDKLPAQGDKDEALKRPRPSKPPPPRPDAATERALVEALLRAVRVAPARRFEGREEIGRGGVGAVSVIFDSVLQRRTAMKKLLDSVRGQPLMVRSFIREAQITAQLDHPNLVPVHDLGVDEAGRVFFTMKLVEGRTLAQLIDEFHEGDHHIDLAYELLTNMLEVLVKVCDALAFAHSRGVIHCDIKAQNIMVGDYGQVYLMDWGFAQLLPPPKEPQEGRRRVEDPLPKLPEAATSGYVFGTPGYMSPEQAQGLTDQLDERTDVFSLGALLYQILSGEVPYRAKTPAETVLLAQRCQYPALEASTVGFYSLRPKELVRIAGKAMAKQPEERYPSVEAFKADLLHYLRGGGHFPTRNVPAGTLIIREGEEADAAFIITGGQCEVYKTVGGKKVPLQVLKTGEVFGEMALLTSAPRSASVAALTDVKLMVVTRDVMEEEMSSMKPWMGAFVRSLASRFREVQEQSLQKGRPGPELPEGRRPWWKFW